MNVIKPLGLLFLLLLSFCSTAATPPTIRLAQYHSPPYYFAENTEAPTGLAIDLLRPVLHQLGWQLQIVICPFPRCLKMLERGEVDVMPGLLRNTEREMLIHFVQPPMMSFHSSFVFYAHPESPTPLHNEQQLQGHSIAVMRDAVYYPSFQKIPNLTKIPVLSEAKALEMVLQKRVDYTIMVEETAAGAFATAGIDPTKLVKQPYSVASDILGYFGFSKRSVNAQYLPELERAMAEQQRLGLYQRLWLRYEIAEHPSSK